MRRFALAAREAYFEQMLRASRRAALALLFGIGASAVAGCVGPTLIVEKYPGPQRPPDEVAILRFYGKDQALLVTIDGERADVRLDEDVRLHVEVLPGKHRVGVVPREDSQGPLRRVSFEVAAGRVYRIVLVPGSDPGLGPIARAYEVDPETDAPLRDVSLQEL